MKKCIKISNLLTHICEYLKDKEIIIFSHSNKSINDSLNPNQNLIINKIFLQSLIEKYFEFDYDTENNYRILKNKKNLSSRFLNSHKNYKEFMKELSRNFNRYNNENIRKKVLDCFRIHMYLPDLRKENVHLEFESSSIHLMVSYDMLFRATCTYNYYSKFITKEYMLNEFNKSEIDNKSLVKEIKILREGLYFEKELKNFKNTFCEFVNNEQYKEILFNVIEYNYKELDFKYINLYSNNKNFECKSINCVIYLLLWITHMFILYSDFVYYYMCDFKDDIDEKIILTEFVHKHNEIINCALLLNSNFENLNIILNNYINYFQYKDLICKKTNSSQTSSDNSTFTNSSKTNFNTSERFSLYKLFFNIIKENVYQRLSNSLLINQFKKLIKNYCNDLFEETKISEKKNNENENDWNEQDDDKSESMIIENDCSDDDEIMEEIMEEKEPNQKEVIESFMNCEVDYMINEKNANAINHSELIVPDTYLSIENLLVNQFEESIKYFIKEEKPISELFQIVEKITKYNTNSMNIFAYSDSLVLIRRTKKILMQKSLQILIQKAIDDYIKSFDTHIKINKKNEFELSLNDYEITNNKEYNCNLSDLSQKTKIKIVEIVGKEIEQLNETLKERLEKLCLSEHKKEQKQKLVDDFSKCDGVQEVLILKKMIWFYYKQLGIYDEKNDKIINILKGKNICQEENDNKLYENKCLINGNQNFQLMKNISNSSS